MSGSCLHSCSHLSQRPSPRFHVSAQHLRGHEKQSRKRKSCLPSQEHTPPPGARRGDVESEALNALSQAATFHPLRTLRHSALTSQWPLPGNNSFLRGGMQNGEHSGQVHSDPSSKSAQGRDPPEISLHRSESDVLLHVEPCSL